MYSRIPLSMETRKEGDEGVGGGCENQASSSLSSPLSRDRPSTVAVERLVKHHPKPSYLTAKIPARSHSVSGTSRPATLAMHKEPLLSKNKVFLLPSKVLKQPPKATLDILKIGACSFTLHLRGTVPLYFIIQRVYL